MDSKILSDRCMGPGILFEQPAEHVLLFAALARLKLRSLPLLEVVRKPQPLSRFSKQAPSLVSIPTYASAVFFDS